MSSGPKVDLSKLKQSDLDFMKVVEQQNLQRVRKLQLIKRRNLVTVGLLSAGVLGIYGYSMFAVHQENFLDDFDVPATTSQS